MFALAVTKLIAWAQSSEDTMTEKPGSTILTPEEVTAQIAIERQRFDKSCRQINARLIEITGLHEVIKAHQQNQEQIQQWLLKVEPASEAFVRLTARNVVENEGLTNAQQKIIQYQAEIAKYQQRLDKCSARLAVYESSRRSVANVGDNLRTPLLAKTESKVRVVSKTR